MTKNINVKTGSRTEFLNITLKVQQVVKDSGVKSGICYVYVPHTTAAVTINEGADPSVVKDILSELNRVIPRSNNYLHMEGNSDAHIKTSLIGSSETVIVEGGKLQLGTWQAIFFCDFDGPRDRQVIVKVTGE
ncbi:MAG: YjbQ family protein [Nitrospiraceae bacterium]|nr:MAG: YjbQ family protein [Nitrospiraceae bacterium]